MLDFIKSNEINSLKRRKLFNLSQTTSFPCSKISTGLQTIYEADVKCLSQLLL